ncbi:MAG: nitroreductase/quinone reductase family protein [Chloroflexota bacterium]
MQINWHRMKNIQKIHQVLYAIGLGPLIGRIILLLTTTGRKSGVKRVTPLQYEEIDGLYYLGAARGTKADWVQNIQACPHVALRVGKRKLDATAEVVTNPCRIADFLEVRLKRHPHMIGLMMERVHHLPKHPSRSQLEELARNEALVVVHPVGAKYGK